MATTVSTLPTEAESSSALAQISSLVRSILLPLASLKLTVFLLVAAVLVTWIATLDQARIDIVDLKAKHFSNLIVEVPFTTLLVPAWFPTLQGVQGSFYVPSGITLLVAMLINLTAAHVLRFRVRARGVKLVAGLFLFAVFAVMTWLIVFYRPDATGFQTHTSGDWLRLWSWIQVLLLGLGTFSVAAIWMVAPERKVERVILGSLGIAGLLILVLLVGLGEHAFVGDSAMRILWQLLQATVVGLVGLLACFLLFHRKAGIVLLHLGLAGLMANEIYVTQTNVEQRIAIAEGQTASTAYDIRESEIVVIDRSDASNDRVVTFPQSLLTPGGTLEHDEIPFKVRIIDYYRNSDIFPSDTGSRADKGLGQFFIANEKPPANGASSDSKANIASCYVEIFEGDRLLGEWLLSDGIYLAYGIDSVVDSRGKEWNIALRYKTEYKDYKLTLTDVQRKDYIGTKIPRWYSSDVVITTDSNTLSSEQKISMNNPLRYRGETFYQSGYDIDKRGRESSVIQVVTNRGWMIPYVCCMIVIVGLVAQFGISMIAFLEKRVRAEQKMIAESSAAKLAGDSEKNASGKIGTWIAWLVPVTITLVISLWVLKQGGDAYNKPVTKNDMRLDLLGQIPVAFGGRVKPLDSVARNLARNLSNREEVLYRNDRKMPAIRWLADTMFRSDGHDEYRVFRIEDLSVQQALGYSFQKERGLKFTLAELQKADDKLSPLVDAISKKKPEARTVFERRILAVRGMLEQLEGVRIPMVDTGDVVSDPAIRLDIAAQLAEKTGMPMAVPTGSDDPGLQWTSVADESNRQWLGELAGRLNADDPAIFALTLSEDLFVTPWVEREVVQGLIGDLIRDPEDLQRLKEITGESSTGGLINKLQSKETWDSIPREVYEDNMEAVEAEVLSRAEEVRRSKGRETYEKILAIMGDVKRIEPPDNEWAGLLAKLGPAYRDSDAETFNSTIENYLAKLNDNPPPGVTASGLATETWYNRFSPFYLAMVVFLLSFVATIIGWIGYSRPLNRTGSWLLVIGLVIVTVGLVARVVISGRPPITNLYTTFLFVGGGAAVFGMCVERITRGGIGNMIGSVVGFLCLLWAWTMTISDGDSFTVLVAVLDTQFWLSTHVVLINLGYCATLAAGFLGIVYIIKGFLQPGFDKQSRQLLGNVIYGVVCFGLLFSFFGTVLGGLWADDSWGRFWGWDPKENGALMIVLWNAVVLHARWGGMVRERGVAALAVLGNVFTMWSWIAVNEMGVGLHAYADSEGGKMYYVTIFWAVMLGMVAIAMLPTGMWASYRRDRQNSAILKQTRRS